MQWSQLRRFPLKMHVNIHRKCVHISRRNALYIYIDIGGEFNYIRFRVNSLHWGNRWYDKKTIRYVTIWFIYNYTVSNAIYIQTCLTNSDSFYLVHSYVVCSVCFSFYCCCCWNRWLFQTHTCIPTGRGGPQCNCSVRTEYATYWLYDVWKPMHYVSVHWYVL